MALGEVGSRSRCLQVSPLVCPQMSRTHQKTCACRSGRTGACGWPGTRGTTTIATSPVGMAAGALGWRASLLKRPLSCPAPCPRPL